MVKTFLAGFAYVIIFICSTEKAALAQTPDCSGNGGLIYLHGGGGLLSSYPYGIYNWDPTQPLAPNVNPYMNSVPMPESFNGFAAGPNINGPGPDITFYTTDSGNYFYYDGATWVNTGHSYGAASAVNIAAGGGFVYSLIGLSGNPPNIAGAVFKYDGTGDATLLTTVPGWMGLGPYDLAADCKGNFYIVKAMAPAWLRKYNSSGVLVQQWNIVAPFGVTQGAGIAIVNDTLYYENGLRIFKGAINNGPVIDVTQIYTVGDIGIYTGDYAQCPVGKVYLDGGNDTSLTVYRGCSAATINFHRDAAINRPYTFRLDISGTAINGTDYQFLPDSLTIPSGLNDATLDVTPLLASVPTGTRQVIIRVMARPCDNIGPDEVRRTITVDILDSLGAAIITPLDTICSHTVFEIEAVVDAGLHYEWQPVQAIPDPLGLIIHPRPNVSTTYTLTVTQPGAPASCPPRTLAYKLHVEQYPVIEMPEKEITFCENDSIDIQSWVLPGNDAISYLWSPPEYLRDVTSSNNKFAGPVGDYTKTFTATTLGASCTSSDSMVIHILPAFEIASVTPRDTLIKYGDAIELSSESDAVMWVWSPGKYLSDVLLQSPVAKPEEPMEYILTAFNEFGCVDTAVVHIGLIYDNRVDIPNAFSPNGDGLNDIFRIENYYHAKLLEFKVFNRFGQMVFETTNPARGWDGRFKGKPCEVEVYHYFIRLSFPDNTNKAFKGDVTLLR